MCLDCYEIIETVYTDGKAVGECPQCQEPYKRKQPSMEIVDMKSWFPKTRDGRPTNGYYLEWLELKQYRDVYYVWYGVGQWDGHMMNWRGCNYFHGRLPKSPMFNNVREAILWMQVQLKAGAYKDGMYLTGHHSGEGNCRLCGDRETEDYFIHELVPCKTQKSWAHKGGKPIPCKYRFKKDIPWFN